MRLRTSSASRSAGSGRFSAGFPAFCLSCGARLACRTRRGRASVPDAVPGGVPKGPGVRSVPRGRSSAGPLRSPGRVEAPRRRDGRDGGSSGSARAASRFSVRSPARSSSRPSARSSRRRRVGSAGGAPGRSCGAVRGPSPSPSDAGASPARSRPVRSGTGRPCELTNFGVRRRGSATGPSASSPSRYGPPVRGGAPSWCGAPSGSRSRRRRSVRRAGVSSSGPSRERRGRNRPPSSLSWSPRVPGRSSRASRSTGASSSTGPSSSGEGRPGSRAGTWVSAERRLSSRSFSLTCRGRSRPEADAVGVGGVVGQERVGDEDDGRGAAVGGRAAGTPGRSGAGRAG